MNLEINTANILKIIGVVITVGGLLWGLSEKFNQADERLASIEAKMDMLLEERLAKMEKDELYKRMTEILKVQPSEEE